MVPVITAYFDESGDLRHDFFVMAGVLLRASQIREFNREWRAGLGRRPGLGYFKESQRRRMTGEFASPCWTRAEARRRVRLFQDVIRDNISAHLTVHVPMLRYREIIRHRVKKEYDQPYRVAFPFMLKLLAEFAEQEEVKRPFVCVFDEHETCQGYAADVYRRMKRRRGHRIGKWLGPISFANDEEEMPIQAADLLASIYRVEPYVRHWYGKRTANFGRLVSRGGVSAGFVLDDNALWAYRKAVKAHEKGVPYQAVRYVLGDD